MDQTFGFIEVWLADILHIEYLEYALENGSIAAAVGQDGFNESFTAISYLWEKFDQDDAFRPRVVDSIISGMKIAIHKYWANDDLLNDLTGERAKLSEVYLNVIGIGPGRFSLDAIKDEINNRNINIHQDNNADINNNEAIPEEQNVDIKQNKELQFDTIPIWKTRIEEIVHIIKSITYLDPTRDEIFGEDKVRVVSFKGEEVSDDQFDRIIKTAKGIKKSVICIYSASDANLIIDALKRNYNMDDISKYVLFFIHSLPTSKFTLTENAKSLCFGYEIDEIYKIPGTSNENDEINKIRNDNSLNDAEKQDSINLILAERKNSPIYKFDGIYKDTVTNVIWAVKDRCIIYFLIPYSTGKNTAVYKCIYNELIRRYLKSLPYRELVKIDLEYMEKMHSNNKEDYINFAVESSKVITEQIKKKMEQHRSQYKEHLDQAMEHAKLFQKYFDQISYFDEKKFIKDQRNKANENYEQTMAIDKISAITVKDNTVHVYTHNLYAQDERTKRWHDIGTFHIAIGMHSNAYDANRTVIIKNTKHMIQVGASKMNAPHVWENGTFCHGNLASGMIDAYKRKNLFELVYQLILFLESANTSDSAGEKVNRWPEVSEEVALNTDYNQNSVYEIMEQMAQAEKKFDDALADAIPIHI